MAKYDGVQRGKVGNIIRGFEEKGFKCVAMKMWSPPVDHWKEHYIELAGRDFYENFCKKMAEGPVVGMVWEGIDVIR